MNQATFGPTLKGVAAIKNQGPKNWILEQFSLPVTQYTVGLDFVHVLEGNCDRGVFDYHIIAANCQRDNFYSDPIIWEFNRQAIYAPDQLRGRIAFAMSEILVGQGEGSTPTYGMRLHQQNFRNQAFGNFYDMLRAFALSPMTGDFINNVNNEGKAPNQNFGREFLQLFSVGPCLLNQDGTQVNGRCMPTYTETIALNHAYSLSGMTYPKGGYSRFTNPSPDAWNPTFFGGPMVFVAAKHESPAAIAAGTVRELLSGVKITASKDGPAAFEAVMNGVKLHPNVAPFICKQLIQRLVTSNPRPEYVARVAAAFTSGQYGDIGTGLKGDLKATIAAILLDTEARDLTKAAHVNYGKLKEPIIYMASLFRALEGSTTDGRQSGRQRIGDQLGQLPFFSATVFNFFHPDNPLPGRNPNALYGPEFEILGSNELVARANFDNELLFRGYNFGIGIRPKCEIHIYPDKDTGICPSAPDGLPRLDSPWDIITHLEYKSLTAIAQDASVLVRTMNTVFAADNIPEAELLMMIDAVGKWTLSSNTADNGKLVNIFKTDYLTERVKLAMYLVRKSVFYQIQR
ncbi:MAG: DUF1800 family protein [Pseudomonadota bacterium]